MSRLRAPAFLAVLVVVVGTLVEAAVLYVPHLKSRVVSTGTPVPQPLFQFTLFPVPGHTSACLGKVAVEPGAQDALFDIQAEKPGPPLLFNITGDSYRQTYRVSGYGTGRATIPFQGPPSSQLTTVCVTNLGDREIQLRGTNEPRTLSRPPLTIGGAPAAGEFSLAFRSANGVSKFKLVDTIADRIAAFKPVWVQPWLVIVLLALVLVGFFAVPLLALWRSFALDES
jgi:hypothetical protein